MLGHAELLKNVFVEFLFFFYLKSLLRKVHPVKKKITILSNNYASLDTPTVIYSLEFLIPRFIKTKFTDSSYYKSLVNIWCHINVFELSISCCFKINIQKYCGSPSCATLDVLCTRNFPRINTSFFRLDMALFFSTAPSAAFEYER